MGSSIKVFGTITIVFPLSRKRLGTFDSETQEISAGIFGRAAFTMTCAGVCSTGFETRTMDVVG